MTTNPKADQPTAATATGSTTTTTAVTATAATRTTTVPPAPAPATTSSWSPQVNLQITQDGELLGNERFVRRLFLPKNLNSQQSEPVTQSRLTLHSSHGSNSLGSSVELRLSVDMNPAGEPRASQDQLAPIGGGGGASERSLSAQLVRDPGAEEFSESFQMIDLLEDDSGSLSQVAYSSVKIDASSLEQMPQQQQQQQQPEETIQQQRQSHSTGDDSCKFTFEKVFQRNFLGASQSFVIAKKKKLSSEEIAIRIRSGPGGRSEWLNELQVYLVPNFAHPNILDFLGSDQSQSLAKKRPSRVVRDDLPRISDIRRRNYLLDSCEELRARELNEKENLSLDDGVRIRLQYWLLNRFDNCIVLRDYLREQVLDWPQMIHIARGIINGLHYLHENGDYQCIDKDQAVQKFIESTNGALKRVAFVDKNSKILMWPQHTCSIVHQNLNSMNIVLRGPELTPCIWNFGHSKIYHPFQPTNHVNLIDKRLKDVFMSSPYSAPEVLQERAHLTVVAMKSIDMYACGILFWELMSRCRLPKMLEASEQEHLERTYPEQYCEPFEREFGPNASTSMLSYAVCRLHARPELKQSWLSGKKSYFFTRTIQELWDQDFDARVHTSTVMDRLGRIDLSDEDCRHDFKPKTSKSFDYASHWPPKIESFQVPPFLDKCEPNLVYLD